ncbi:TetR/AcrR family transcriptional regulator [Sinomonas terrae]|uniref:TetR/AcrR family transcriptional regulator n=1 Tax=Sinomonas terrae TaxID=2908838 RepID=A0ABS9U7C5_9MICC|nr:TetR/AcrR family transcriptional regulator [Sinomonas terrae]MCH6472579.1 TetR/AcrR family transcriptional regulator [Sinomonas terrae]
MQPVLQAAADGARPALSAPANSGLQAKRARQRVLDAAYELFARRGIRHVGVDELIARSGVAKATFYKHFRTKDDLVLAYLERWFHARTASIQEAAAQGGTPDAALLAVFDAFESWFREGAAETRALLQVLVEMGPDHPLGAAAAEYMDRTRAQVAEMAGSAGVPDPEGFAWSVHILVKGALVADLEGDEHAASRAKEMATLLLHRHRPPPYPPLAPQR